MVHQAAKLVNQYWIMDHDRANRWWIMMINPIANPSPLLVSKMLMITPGSQGSLMHQGSVWDFVSKQLEVPLEPTRPKSALNASHPGFTLRLAVAPGLLNRQPDDMTMTSLWGSHLPTTLRYQSYACTSTSTQICYRLMINFCQQSDAKKPGTYAG